MSILPLPAGGQFWALCADDLPVLLADAHLVREQGLWNGTVALDSGVVLPFNRLVNDYNCVGLRTPEGDVFVGQCRVRDGQRDPMDYYEVRAIVPRPETGLPGVELRRGCGAVSVRPPEVVATWPVEPAHLVLRRGLERLIAGEPERFRVAVLATAEKRRWFPPKEAAELLNRLHAFEEGTPIPPGGGPWDWDGNDAYHRACEGRFQPVKAPDFDAEARGRSIDAWSAACAAAPARRPERSDPVTLAVLEEASGATEVTGEGRTK